MSVLNLFLLVLMLTAVSFGGGNMLQAGLDRELVQNGVITPEQFQAGVALGQATPGPLAAFNTAIGKTVGGVPGAIAATLALVVVSLAAVFLMRRIPESWFQMGPVRSALNAVGAYVAAILFFLAFRGALAGNHAVWATPLAIIGLVVIGRMRRIPSVWLILGAVALGALTQGTGFAGW